MSRMSNDDKLSMRLPAELKAELQRRADAESRSLAAYIVLALQQHLAWHEDLQVIDAWLLAMGKTETELAKAANARPDTIELLRNRGRVTGELVKVLSYIRRNMPRSKKS